MEEEGSMLPQRYSRSSRSPSGISNSPDRGERCQTRNCQWYRTTNHGRSDFGHGRNCPEVRGKVRLQVEVEPLDVQRR